MAKANKQLRNCNNAIQRFIRNKNKFANFESFEAWYVNAIDNNDNTADREIEHLDAIKKHFDIEQVIKIFSKAANYDPRTTKYQVSFLYKKGMMPQSCNNLQTEGICMKHLDKTAQCGRVKNPLVFR